MYEGLPRHRVVRDGWFQTGDVLGGDGRGVTSSFGEKETFADETFKRETTRRGCCPW